MIKVIVSLAFPLLLTVGCVQNDRKPAAARTVKVRTTAYAAAEGSSKNAIGGRLSYGAVKSAAADWSRYPLGTKFRIVGTSDVYQIDDYGSALIGKNTIDLYKPSMRSMRAWGVRHVEIEVIEWGSPVRSLEVLKPRSRHRIVRAMVAGLRSQT